MKFTFLIVLLFTTDFGLFADDQADGVYTMCSDVSGYSGETIELLHGKFRYWFYSDIPLPEPKYPIEGNFHIDGDKIILDNEKVTLRVRTKAVLNGVSVLFRDDGLKDWTNLHKLKAYAILIKITVPTVDAIEKIKRPAFSLIGGE